MEHPLLPQPSDPPSAGKIYFLDLPNLHIAFFGMQSEPVSGCLLGFLLSQEASQSQESFLDTVISSSFRLRVTSCCRTT